jgi:7,8-dihydropterin-6-yl-methyl-4-(beta-D-ribofuranosyl)aminobenzene 5'-phosphate synthase
MTTPELPLLDQLELTVVVDNETDTLSSVDPGVDQLPESASLMGRLPPSRFHDGHAGVCVFDHLCVACHGLSVLVTARRGDEHRTVLFDVGPYAHVWLDNAERLAVDLAAIELVFLSHWHADHSGGFPAVVEAIAAARSAAGRPPPIVALHPDRPDQRGVRLADGSFALLPPEPTFAEIEAAGGAIERHAEAHGVADLLVGSGLIERVTDYETGLVGHHSFVGDDCRPDPLILDERFLAGFVRGRGVTVLSACSHAGVVNACLGAMALAPGEPVDTVLGGYHLAGGSMEPRIGDTVRDLAERVRPRIVAPGHCTGWRAKAALAAAFAPGRYGPSVVGSRYTLRAEG